jgi:phosphatidylglycerol:prolipoprotein diacylglycerol transferase
MARSGHDENDLKPRLEEIPFPWFGPIPIHGYGLMIVIGFLLGCWLAARETRRRGLPDRMYDLGLVMLLAGVLGGRTFYFIQYYDTAFAGSQYPFLEFFKIWKGGLVFYGGAILGLLGGFIYLWRKRLPMADFLDCAGIGAPIAMAFGRIGCFLNGCCFGKVCDASYPLAVRFPLESPARASHLARGLLGGHETTSLPVHPVQLYQAAHDFMIFGLVYWYLRRAGTPRGAGMPLLFALYGIGRFLLEGLRGDHSATFTGLTVSQNLSLALLVLFGGAFVFILLREPFGAVSAGPAAVPGRRQEPS